MKIASGFGSSRIFDSGSEKSGILPESTPDPRPYMSTSTLSWMFRTQLFPWQLDLVVTAVSPYVTVSSGDANPECRERSVQQVAEIPRSTGLTLLSALRPVPQPRSQPGFEVWGQNTFLGVARFLFSLRVQNNFFWAQHNLGRYWPRKSPRSWSHPTDIFGGNGNVCELHYVRGGRINDSNLYYFRGG